MLDYILAFTNIFLIIMSVYYMPRKGITSVIATLMLIVIAIGVCAMAGILSWNLVRDATKIIMEKIGGVF